MKTFLIWRGKRALEGQGLDQLHGVGGGVGEREGRKLNSLAAQYISAKHRIHFLFLVLPPTFVTLCILYTCEQHILCGSSKQPFFTSVKTRVPLLKLFYSQQVPHIVCTRTITVTHISGGEGKVVSYNLAFLVLRFPCGTERFINKQCSILSMYHIWKPADLELSKGKLVVSFRLPSIIF